MFRTNNFLNTAGKAICFAALAVTACFVTRAIGCPCIAQKDRSSSLVQSTRDASGIERPRYCIAHSGNLKTLRVRFLKTKRNECLVTGAWSEAEKLWKN